MEPFGVAAGGLQVVDASAHIVRFARNLRDAPERLTSLLEDVEQCASGLQSLHDSLHDPNSAYSRHLPAGQVQSLASGRLGHALQASTAAREYIQGSQISGPSAPHSKISRLSRRIRAAVDSGKLQSTAERMERLASQSGRDMTREVETAMLDQLGGLKSDLSSLQHALLSCQSEVIAQGRNLETNREEHLVHFQALTSTTTSTRDEISKASSDVRDLSQQFDGIRSQLNDISSLLSPSPSDAVVTRSYFDQQLESMKKELLEGIMGKREELSPTSRAVIDQCSSQDFLEVEKSVTTSLVTYPSAIRESLSSSPSWRSEMQCSCRRVTTQSRSQWGPISLESRSSIYHEVDCIFHCGRAKAVRKTLWLNLFPLIQNVIGIVCEGTSPASANWVTVTLRVDPTVQRSTSPLFRLVDQLIEGTFCDRPKASDASISVENLDGKGTWSCLTYKPESLLPSLERFLLELTLGLKNREFSLREQNEFGFTILHELALFVDMLHEAKCDTSARNIADLLGQILDLVLRLDIDPTNSMPSTERCLQLFPFSLATVDLTFSYNQDERSDFARALSPVVWMILRLQAPIHGSTLDHFLYSFLTTYEGCFRLCHRHFLFIRSFRRYHSYDASYFVRLVAFVLQQPRKVCQLLDLGAVETAVACRDERLLQNVLAQLSIEKHRINLDDTGIPPLVLATGWGKGLRLLLEAGFNPLTGLGYAFFVRDGLSTILMLRAVWALLDSSWDFSSGSFTSRHFLQWQPYLRNIASAASEPEFPREVCDEIHLIVAELLRNRRLMLVNTAIRHGILPISHASDVNIKFPRMVFSSLQAKGIPLQGSIFPGISHPRRTLMDSFFRLNWETVETGGFLAALARAGFNNALHDFFLGLCDTDTPVFEDETFRTPKTDALCLFSCPHSTDPCPDPRFWCFDESSSCSAPLQFNQFCNSIFGVSTRDSCVCFCSDGGCLPLRWHSFLNLWPSMASRPGVFGKLVGECSMNHEEKEVQFAALCRLLAFHHLGMTHTCTCLDRARKWRSVIAPDERQKIRDEEHELASQLARIVEAYSLSRSRSRLPVESFADIWRRKLVRLLPTLEEPFRFKDPEKKVSELQGAALASLGYAGMDFGDVIEDYFKVELAGGELTFEEDEGRRVTESE